VFLSHVYVIFIVIFFEYSKSPALPGADFYLRRSYETGEIVLLFSLFI